jgi:hypothetical protein
MLMDINSTIHLPKIAVSFQGVNITNNYISSSFPGGGDLETKYLAGGVGMYTREANGSTWTKQ